MSVDPGILYRRCRERITALVTAEGVDPELPVPATPGWTLHDVVAHLAGVSEDAATGNMAGAPGDAWTAAQIERSRGRTVADLIDLWQQHAARMEAFFSSPQGEPMLAGVFDAHCHEADLRHALGLPFDIPADFLGWVGPRFRSALEQQAAAAGLPVAVPDIDDAEWFRGRLGRRTEAEVRAYPWPVDPEPYLPLFFVFGRAAQPLGER